MSTNRTRTLENGRPGRFHPRTKCRGWSGAMAHAAVGLLDSISEFCRRAGMAESTFGRRAVNDGKFVSRLRDGARITPETLERVSAFLTTQGVEAPTAPRELLPLLRV